MLQCGIIAGSNPYKLRVNSIDTLTRYRYTTPFADYSILFGSFYINAGAKLEIGRNQVHLSGGMGATLYTSIYPASSYGITISNPNVSYTVFSSRMNSRNTASGFCSASASYEINYRFSIFSEYVHHLSPAATGNFTFNHTRDPLEEDIKVFQREVRIGLLMRLSKQNYPKID